MPLPGSHREKQVLQEIVEPVVETTPEPQAEFLQEIKEPTHEETLVEQPKRRRRSKKR
jgi:hypothetical protein